MAPIKQTELLAREEPSGGTAMHWIGGQWLDSGEHRESINPCDGRVSAIQQWLEIHRRIYGKDKSRNSADEGGADS